MKITNFSNKNYMIHFKALSMQNMNNKPDFDTYRKKYARTEINWNYLKHLITLNDEQGKEYIDPAPLKFIETCLQFPHCDSGHNLVDIISTSKTKTKNGQYKIDKNALLFAEKMLEFGNNVNDVNDLLLVLKAEYKTIFKEDGKIKNFPYLKYAPEICHYTKFDEDIMSDILYDAISRNNPNYYYPTKYSALDYYRIILHCKANNKYHNKMDYNEFYRILKKS